MPLKLSNSALIAGAAIAGCGLLAYYLPRAHPAASWNVRVDRQQSIVKAREISAALGVDTSKWEATVSGGTDGKRGYYLKRHPNDDSARRFTPINARITFAAPGKPDRVVVRLSANGDANMWERRGAAQATATSTSGDAALQARNTAERALQLLAGRDAGGFGLVTEAASAGKNLLFAWERPGELAQRFEATVDGSRLVKAELQPVFSKEFNDAFESRKRSVDRLDAAAGILVYMAGTAFAGGVYIYWLVRRAVRRRFVFAMTATAMAGHLISWFNWERFSETSNINIGGSPVSAAAGAAFLLVFLTLFYIVVTGAADGVGVDAKMATLRSLFSASIFNRRAGVAVLAGLLCGPLITALPLCVSSWHLFGSEQTGDYSASLIYSIHPSLEAIEWLISPAILGIFGIGAGFLGRWIRKPAMALVILFALGTLLFGSLVPPSETSTVPYLVNGAVIFAILHAVYRRFDILAALAAGYAAQLLWSASAMLLQPARSLHVSGMTALAFLAGSTVCAALVAWRGRELAIAEAAGGQVRATSQREALMAEFSIAHRVQQHMLPDKPPEIPGCTIAASCQPALEVGGDLFDFLKLPDGRWTIGVGDVSGKGVPAALYMTLTKGLLAATTRDSSDLLDIVASVNYHIHSVAERRTFVTMAVGAFDPETRSFDHVRAGHNPIVWRRASENATRLLTAPGLGLGLAPDRVFRRTTEVERIQLNQGDLLLFYSDGLTEAMNSAREQFGEQRLMRAVEAADGLDASAVRESVLSTVRTFLGGIPAQDDMTLVALRVN